MHIDFTAALQELGPDAAFRIANEVTPGPEYLFASILPEQSGLSYVVSEKNMTVRSMMAGMVGMDSPYPPTGYSEISSELWRTIKVANHSTLPEEVMRQLQLVIGGGMSTQQLASEALNFLDKVVLQPHFDTAEWLRGEAMINGQIQWTFNDIDIDVNYNIPASNMLTHRSGTDAYHDSTSKFWDDVAAAKKALRYNLSVAVAHSSTIDAIIGNPANKVNIIGEAGGSSITIQQYVGDSDTGMRLGNTDTRYTLTLVAYDLEGELFDVTDPTTPIIKQFMPSGKVLYVGTNSFDRVYRVGMGSTIPVDADRAVGYTHLAPTVEGGGAPGRWSRLFVPEARPWQLTAEGVTNLLPIITAPKKIVVASTDMPA